MRPSTIEYRRRLYLLARVVIARHYNRPLTLDAVAKALACSPRQLTRAFAQFGNATFREELLARRLAVAAQMLVEQPTLRVRDVARAVGYRQAPHFARAFRHRYGLTPARFRASARAGASMGLAGSPPAANTAPVGARSVVVADATSSAPCSGGSGGGATPSARSAARARPVPPQPARRPVGAGASACRPLGRGGR